MPHWSGLLIVAILLIVLFGGRGRISSVMGDFAKGITSFRKGLRDEESGDETAKDESGSLGTETRDDEKTGS